MKTAELSGDKLCNVETCTKYLLGWTPGTGAYGLLIHAASIGHSHSYGNCNEGDDNFIFGYNYDFHQRLSHCSYPTAPGKIDWYYSGAWRGCHENGAGSFSCEDYNADEDNDGMTNKLDLCPNTPLGEEVNINGCSCSQITIPFRDCHEDTCEGDNLVDYPIDGNDICSKGEITQMYPCEVINSDYSLECDTDDDNDGVLDIDDICFDTPEGEAVNVNGCSCSQIQIQFRDCPDDQCNEETWIDYAEDGFDTCIEGEITQEYSCGLISSAYNKECDLDDDDDQVLDKDDKCHGTILPESIPIYRLILKRNSDVDGDSIFETRNKMFRPIEDSSYSLEDTYGLD